MDDNYHPDDLPDEQNATERFLSAFQIVNGIALKIGQNLQDFSVRLAQHGENLVAISKRPASFSATQVTIVLEAVVKDLIILTDLIASSLPTLGENIEIASLHAPNIADWIDFSILNSQDSALDLLSSFANILDAVSAAINDIETFHENISGLKGIDPKVDESATSLMTALDDLRVLYNEYWFLCGDMRTSIENKLN
jgi:hypothetical protein